MAEQTAIGYEQTKEWKQFQTGGTRVDADDLNRMEGGIVDACAGVDQLRTKRLPTYLVAQDGDTATQDLYLETILGPCLILDLAKRATYYDNGEDGDGHERILITSGSDIDALRDSLSRFAFGGYTRNVRFTVDGSSFGIVFMTDDTDGYILLLPISDNGRCKVLHRTTSGDAELKTW